MRIGSWCPGRPIIIAGWPVGVRRTAWLSRPMPCVAYTSTIGLPTTTRPVTWSVAEPRSIVSSCFGSAGGVPVHPGSCAAFRLDCRDGTERLRGWRGAGPGGSGGNPGAHPGEPRGRPSPRWPGTGAWRITESPSPKPFRRRRGDGPWQEGQKPAGSFSLSPPGLAMPVKVTALGLARTAFERGFGSQGQFTTTFTRLVGISPGRWRAERRRQDLSRRIGRRPAAPGATWPARRSRTRGGRPA